VVAPHVLISGVGESGEIEIQNPSDSEADISLWNIISTSKIFKIPDGTYVLPGKTIVLPTDITGLSSADVSSLRLVLPSGVVVSEYPNVAMPVRKSVTTYTDNTLSVKSNSEPAPADNGSEISPLSANVLSGIASAGAENKGNSKIPTVVFLFIGIIGLAGASFIAFRHRNLFMSGINGAENIPLSETEKIANSIRIIEEE
jgi:hypothetical protein